MGASQSAFSGQENSGTSFEILEESLANAKVDVIVNSCNQALLLAHGGMSRALVRAAGPGLQAECSERYPNGVDFGEIAVTGGYRLACKSVYHIALPQWGSEFVDPLKVLQSSVSTCLAHADSHGMKSIAFPALGCGFLNYPHDVVAQTMHDCLRQFESNRRSSSLRKVVVCVSPQGSDWKHVKEAFIRESKKEDSSLLQRSEDITPETQRKQTQNPKQVADILDELKQSEYCYYFLSTCIRETSHNACKKVLDCGHVCCGYRGEPVCPPCMQAECGGSGKQNQTAQDDCIICYSEHLGAAPVANLRCGHIFHLHCVKRILQNRWVGPKINFNFTKCPVCKKAIDHPDLQSLMDPIRSLEEDITQKALIRLDYDGLKDCRELTQRSSKYYRRPELFAMDRYIYYMCFKCQKAFYGGTEREGCGAQEDATFDPTDLICPKCRGKHKQPKNTDADVAKAVHSRQNAEADKVIKSTTKACPHCKVRTEKDGGCMHMTCAKCRMDWCWLCERQWCRECQSKHWFGENNDEEGRLLFRLGGLLVRRPTPLPRRRFGNYDSDSD